MNIGVCLFVPLIRNVKHTQSGMYKVISNITRINEAMFPLILHYQFAI